MMTEQTVVFPTMDIDQAREYRIQMHSRWIEEDTASLIYAVDGQENKQEVLSKAHESVSEALACLERALAEC
jgi:hypothetical protein